MNNKSKPVFQMQPILAFSTLLLLLPLPIRAQTADPQAKPSPYTGVSQPPPDETIVSSPDAPPPVVQPAPQTAYSPAVGTASQPVLVTRPVDPDAGIVTRPHSTYVETERSASRAVYGSADPDAGIVTFVPRRPGELPQGTNIHIKLAQQLSSTETRAGMPFRGQVAKDVMLDGRVIIPQGSELRGRVQSVREGHRFGNKATIRLRPDEIVLPDGSRYTLHADVIGAHSRNVKVDGEGAITTKSQVKKDAVEEGIGAGAGAITGAAVGGPGGAAVGTLVGVGVVTAHLIVQRPQTINMPTDSTVVFSLTEPLDLTPTQN